MEKLQSRVSLGARMRETSPVCSSRSKVPPSKVNGSSPTVARKVSSSPSTSVAIIWPTIGGPSSKPSSRRNSRTGASLTGSTVTETVAVSVSSPSVTVTVKESEPLKFSSPW